MAGRQDMRTPRWLVDILENMIGETFSLDAAAGITNYICDDWCKDGLQEQWADWTFCNPPFAKTTLWVDKALSECAGSVLVLPAGCSQKWFHRLLGSDRTTIYFPDKRINFDLPDGTPTKNAPLDSIVVKVFPSWWLHIGPKTSKFQALNLR